MVNVSKHILTDAERAVLQKGQHFAATPNSMPIDDIIAKTEQACQSLPPSQASELRSSITRSIRKTPALNTIYL